jgi:hypothetical protein
MAANLHSFLTRFVRPLVLGGELSVTRPISLPDLDLFEAQLPHVSEAVIEIDDGRGQVLAPLLCRPPSLVLDRDELALAAAVHNALFLAHPEAEGPLVTQRARRRMIDASQAMAARPLSPHRGMALARHGLLHNLFRITRRDIAVSWWTGRANYVGQAPPGRLTRWPTLRRVSEQRSEVGFDELLVTPDAAPITATVLRRSPLTQLLSDHRAAPPLYWEDAAFLLRDVELARAITYHALAADEVAGQLSAPARFAAALEQMLERAPRAADVRAVLGFLLHLAYLLFALELRGSDSERVAIIPTMMAAERAAERPRGLATFFALPVVAGRLDSRLALPPGLSDDGARQWKAVVSQAQAAVGPAILEALSHRLARHLGADGGLSPEKSVESGAPGSGVRSE